SDAAKDGKYDPNTPVVIIYSTQQAGWNEIAAALDHDLTAIGMKHTMTPSDDAAWTSAIGAGQDDISLQCCGSPGLGPWQAPGSFTGKAGTMWSDPAVTDAFNKAAASGDPAEQASLYKQAGAIINKGAPYDWLWAVAHTDAYTDKLTPLIYPNARESFAQI